MVIAVFMNVVLRYTAGTGFASSEELARLLFVWLVCMGAILASAENRHLGFDLVQSRLPRRARLSGRVDADKRVGDWRFGASLIGQ